MTEMIFFIPKGRIVLWVDPSAFSRHIFKEIAMSSEKAV